jgi:hypothetical protein
LQQQFGLEGLYVGYMLLKGQSGSVHLLPRVPAGDEMPTHNRLYCSSHAVDPSSFIVALSKVEQTSASLQKIYRENGVPSHVCWKDNVIRVLQPASGESDT